MENTDHLDLIAQYFHGELSPEAKVQFETLLDEDSDFVEEVEMAKVLFTVEKVRQKAKWQEWIDENPGNHRDAPNPKSKTPLSPKWIVGILLLLAIPLLIWFFASKPSLTEKANSYLITLECPFSQTMAARPTEDPSWTAAIGDCQQSNYEEVIRILTPQLSNTPPRVLLMVAYSHLRLGQYEEANRFSQQLIETPGHRHLETAYWYLAIGQLLKGETALAKATLGEIITKKYKDWKLAEEWLEGM